MVPCLAPIMAPLTGQGFVWVPDRGIAIPDPKVIKLLVSENLEVRIEISIAQQKVNNHTQTNDHTASKVRGRPGEVFADGHAKAPSGLRSKAPSQSPDMAPIMARTAF